MDKLDDSNLQKLNQSQNLSGFVGYKESHLGSIAERPVIKQSDSLVELEDIQQFSNSNQSALNNLLNDDEIIVKEQSTSLRNLDNNQNNQESQKIKQQQKIEKNSNNQENQPEQQQQNYIQDLNIVSLTQKSKKSLQTIGSYQMSNSEQDNNKQIQNLNFPNQPILQHDIFLQSLKQDKNVKIQNNLNLIGSLTQIDSEGNYSSYKNSEQKIQEKQIKQKLQTLPPKISEKWNRALKWVRLHIKCSAIFSPFTIQKQINDLSAAHANYENIGGEDIEKKQRQKKKSMLQKIASCCFSVYKKIPLINPNNIVCQFFIFILNIINMAIIFILSVDTFYQYGTPIDREFEKYLVYKIAPITFSLDILKNCFSMTFINGFIKKRHFYVLQNYYKTMFIYDLVCLIPIGAYYLPYYKTYVEGYGHFVFLISLLYFSKIPSLHLQYNKFIKSFQSKQSSQLYAELFNLCVFILTLSHICSITYHGLAKFQINTLDVQEGTWLHQADMVDSSVWERYIISFYCSTSSMITVLIFIPQTRYEELYLTFIMIVNCGVFGYSLSELDKIVGSIKKYSTELKSDLTTINRYLSLKKVDKDLQVRVQTYLEYVHSIKKEQNQDEIELVKSKLSNSLQDELKKDVYTQILKDVKFFQDNFSQNFIKNHLYKIIEEKTFQTGEKIFQEGDYKQLGWYFIIKGTAQVVQEVGKREMPQTYIKTLQEGDQFGVIEFLTGNQRSNSIYSEDVITVLLIQRSVFLQYLTTSEYKEKTKDLQTFQLLKDSLQLNEYRKIGIYCYTCHRHTHISRYCPNTHMIFNQVKKQKLLQSFDQERETIFKRIIFQKTNCLLEFFDNEEGALELMENKTNQLEDYYQKYLFNKDSSDQEYSDGYFSPNYSDEEDCGDESYFDNQSSLNNNNIKENNAPIFNDSFNDVVQTQQVQTKQNNQSKNSIMVHNNHEEKQKKTSFQINNQQELLNNNNNSSYKNQNSNSQLMQQQKSLKSDNNQNYKQENSPKIVKNHSSISKKKNSGTEPRSSNYSRKSTYIQNVKNLKRASNQPNTHNHLPLQQIDIPPTAIKKHSKEFSTLPSFSQSVQNNNHYGTSKTMNFKQPLKQQQSQNTIPDLNTLLLRHLSHFNLQPGLPTEELNIINTDDTVKDYKYYYPKHNHRVIIQKINLINQNLNQKLQQVINKTQTKSFSKNNLKKSDKYKQQQIQRHSKKNIDIQNSTQEFARITTQIGLSARQSNQLASVKNPANQNNNNNNNNNNVIRSSRVGFSLIGQNFQSNSNKNLNSFVDDRRESIIENQESTQQLNTKQN